MIKTLIADDNLTYIKQFINNITSKIKSIQVSHICTDGKEILEIIKQNNFDLIFLDLQMPNINGIQIIEEIKKIDFIKIPKIIIISGDISLINYAKVGNVVCDIIQKNKDNEVVYKKVMNIVNEIIYSENYEDIKEKIIEKLINLGYNMKYKGTRYMIDAIMYIYTSNNFNLVYNLEKNVYKYVSLKNKESLVNIKNNIVKSSKNIVEDDVRLSAKDVITRVLIELNKEFLFHENVG